MIDSYVGPMFSGKTANMITMYNRIWNKSIVKCFKPKIDSRDDGIIKSRDFSEGIPAVNINYLEEIYNHIDESTRTIFIDEIQFLQGDVSVLLDLSLNRDIDVYVAGLNMTAEQKPFGIISDVLAISDSIHIINGVCVDCNKPAPYTYYEGGDKKGDILVGNNGYSCVCGRCLVRRRTLNNQK